jgi:hypothetical protein
MTRAKVNINVDEHTRHHEFVEIFFKYLENYERFKLHTSEQYRVACRKDLVKIRKMVPRIRDDILKTHYLIMEMKNEKANKIREQRRLKNSRENNQA